MSEGRRSWPVAVGRWIASHFVERQIIVRANGRVRYLSVSARAQVVTAGTLFLVAAWMAYATLGIVHQARIVAAKEAAIAQARDAYGRLIDKVDSYQATLAALQEELAVRQTHLSRLSEEKRSLDAELSDMRAALDETEAAKGRLEAGRLALHRELDTMAGDLETSQSVNRILAERLSQTRARLAVVQNERARTVRERVQLDRKLWRADDELRDALSRADLLNAELEAISSNLKAVRGERRDLARSNEALRREVTDLEAKLGQRYADIRAEMERRLRALEERQARVRLGLVQDHRREVAAVEAQQVQMAEAHEAKLRDIAAQRETVEAEHRRRVAALKAAHETALARREAEYAAAEEAWEAERRELEATHETALAALRRQREDALAALGQARREGERRDHEAAARLAAMEEAWRRKVIALDTEQALAQRKLEEAQLARLDIVRDRQEREVAALVERHRRERVEAERTWLAERADLLAESDRQIEALKRRHRVELVQQHGAHERELAARAVAQAEALAAQREERERQLARMQRDYAAEIKALGEQLAEERRTAAGAQRSLRRVLTRRMDKLVAEKDATIAALRRSVDSFDSRELAAAMRHEQELGALEAELDRERVEALAKSERLWTERIEMVERTSSQEIARLRRTLAALEGSRDETVVELSRQVDELETMRRDEVESVRRRMEARLAAADAFRREEIARLRETMRERLSALERDMRVRIEHVVAQKRDMERTHRELLTDLVEQTRESARQVETVISQTGLDPDEFVAEAAQEDAVGGPFVAIGPTQLEDVPIEQVARAVAANMARWRVLQQVVRQLPLSAPLETYRVTSLFGKRRDPFNGRWAHHQGMDFKAPRRTPVLATSPGTVVHAGWKGNYGRTVEIDHGHGLVSRYAHLHSVDVKVGQKVGGRAKIGTLGSTGRSTGAHLHYEILLNGERYDPLKFLKAGKDVFKG